MRAFIDWILGRTKLRQVNDTLSAMVSDLQRQVDSLQKQVTHAAKATGEMAAFSREAEVALARVRLSFAQERKINRAALGDEYRVIPEDWWFTLGERAGKHLARLEGSKDLQTPEQLVKLLLEMGAQPAPDVTVFNHQPSQPKQLA